MKPARTSRKKDNKQLEIENKQPQLQQYPPKKQQNLLMSLKRYMSDLCAEKL